MSPVGAALARVALSVLLRRFREALPNNDRAISDAYRESVDEIVFEIQEALRQLPERTALDEGEARAVFERVVTEATHATRRERRRLLAHAVAGVFTPDLGSEMRSRVARAVTQLEPSDVVCLRDLKHGTESVGAGEVRRPQVEALQSTGCILISVEEEELGRALHRATRRRQSLDSVRTQKRKIVTVTALGEAVLASLCTWIPE